MNETLILLLTVPLFTAFLTLFAGAFSRPSLARAFSLGGVVFSLLLVGYFYFPLREGKIIFHSLGGWKEPLGITLYMDGLAWLTSLMGLGIGFFSLLFALGERKYEPNFYFFFLLLLVGMEGVILTGDIFNMFVSLELLSLSTYILIAYPGGKKTLLASFNYLLLSSLGIGFFLLGIALLYQHTGVLSLKDLGKVSWELRVRFPYIFKLALSCILVGIGIKAAFIPLHTWLPDAHAYAPTPVSCILSGVMIKVSFLALWRILSVFEVTQFQYLFLWIGSLTALGGVGWALVQDDLKRLLAYSSISQMGFIVGAFGIGSSLSLVGSFLHIINHSIFKSLLFLSVGIPIWLTGKRKIGEVSPRGKSSFFIFMVSLIGALSISGIPPFNGFISKTLIFNSLKDYFFPYLLFWLAGVGTITSFIKFIRGVGFPWLEKPRVSFPIPLLFFFLLFFLALLCLVGGIFPYFFIDKISLFLLGKRNPFPGPFYTFSSVGESVLVLSLGIGLYLFFFSTGWGKRTLGLLKKFRVGINEGLILLLTGLLIFIFLSKPFP